MFNGIINNKKLLFYIKNLNKKLKCIYFYIKINKNIINLDFTAGDSLILNGFCSTIIKNFYFFIEIEFFKKTLNKNYLNNLKIYFNFEKSINIFKQINGNIILGHINNNSIINNIYYNIYYNYNNYKICFLINFKIKKYLIYKNSIYINGVNLTINEVFFLKKNKILVIVNIINFTRIITNFNKIKIFDYLNIEFDINIYYILNIINK